ncbi:MAG: histidine kinase [Fibrobacter sp.]|nr:histidine kinase [Fibrobacter sp.]
MFIDQDKKRPFYARFEIYYALIWLLVFLIPVISVSYNEHLGSRYLMRSWIRTLPYLMIFIFNQYLLVPRFLLKMQWRRYILWTSIFIFGIHIGHILLNPVIENLLDISFLPRRFKHRPPPYLRIFFSHISVSYLVAGMGAAVLLFRKWIDRERVQATLQQQILQSSLDSLRHQISPHFFMNTLNNIHALIPANPESAQDACVQLSRMMRYHLYNHQHGYTTLKNEFEFVRSYFYLMSLRYDQTVSTTLELPETPYPQGYIPILLLVSFIENAFKHGISYEVPSFITVKISVDEQNLHFHCQNSIPPWQNEKHSKSGIGLDNVRKRLKLLYPHQHCLEIDSSNDTFTVNLRIPYETSLPSH